jgi:hypothetical protein
MKLATLCALGTVCLAAPAAATPLPWESSNIPFSMFDTSTQGIQLDYQFILGNALTFTGYLRTAVYRNAFGTLDFYYQVQRTGGGSIGSDDIRSMTAANFQDYLVDAMFSNADLDGTGGFTLGDNDGGLGTANRNSGGGVIGVNFGPDALSDTQTSATYVFRTNATNYNNLGTFGVSDGSTFSGRAFQPITAVPEPTGWAMLLLGFAGIGTAMRRIRLRVATV